MNSLTRNSWFDKSIRTLHTPCHLYSHLKDEGDACPWAGSLRHVTGPIGHSLAFKPQPLPQFKRYPDEDAPNPFQSVRGSNTRAAVPITPSGTVLE